MDSSGVGELPPLKARTGRVSLVVFHPEVDVSPTPRSDLDEVSGSGLLSEPSSNLVKLAGVIYINEADAEAWASCKESRTIALIVPEVSIEQRLPRLQGKLAPQILEGGPLARLALRERNNRQIRGSPLVNSTVE
jgi:hypothetical protein